MADHAKPLLHQIFRLASQPSVETADAALLERFVSCGDEGAFAAILARHGPMVLGVCRRVLRDGHRAEDAFQATFLVLARKAAALRRPEALAAWLYGTARRLALTARRSDARRCRHETDCRRPLPASAATNPLDELTARELLLALDEEMERLPEAYRLPLILCGLEGRPQEEAARLLGWTPDSVRGRIERGRARLRARLARRGFALGAGLLAMESMTTPIVSAGLAQLTVHRTLVFAAGSVDGIAVDVLTLAEAGVWGMSAAKVKLSVLLLLMMGLTAGASVLAHHMRTKEPPQSKSAAERKVTAPTLVTEKQTAKDRYGDPLPRGAVARLGSERLTLADTGSELTFSPDGRHLATYDFAEQLRIWDLSSGKELLHIKKQPTRWHGKLVYSPDGKTLAMGYGDQAAGTGKVCVREAATGKELHRLGGQLGQRMPSSLSFSPDGRSLFAGGDGRPILCWDLVGGGTPRKIGDFSSAPFVALSRDGKTVTAGRSDGQDGKKWLFARWDLASGKTIGQQMLMTSPTWSGSLSPDGGIFARPDEDGKGITLFDPMTGREISRARGCHYPVSITFSSDGSVMTCRSKDGIVHVWDTATGKVRARFQALSTSIACIVLSPDGTRLAVTGRADYAIHVCDVATGREIHSFAGHRGGPLTVAFDIGGKEIVTVSRDSAHVSPFVTEWADWSFRRWDAASGAELVATRSNPKGEVYHATFSADGRLLATVIHDGTLRLWDVQSGKEVRSWKTPTRVETTVWDEGKPSRKAFKRPHPLISAPVFSPDGKVLLAAHDPKVLRWEVATGRELPAFDAEGTLVDNTIQLAMSPDGQTLAVYRWRPPQQSFLLLDAGNGKLKHELKNLRYWAGQPVFSADGRTFALVEQGGVSLWEVANGQSRGRLRDHMPTALAFSPDGRFLATGNAAGTNDPTLVRLWDMATGQVAGRLQEDCRQATSLAFSPDGSRLAVAGCFPSALVCDVAALCEQTNKKENGSGVAPPAEELDKLWAELSDGDGARAYRAIRRWGLTGSRGAAFLKAKLTNEKAPDERRIARLIADIDNEQFAIREKASAELGKLGRGAEPALRRTLEGEVSAEVRLRINRLLARLGTPPMPPPSAKLIRLRVVEALEANSSEEARQVLVELAKNATDAALRQDAKGSLERLSRRPAPLP